VRSIRRELIVAALAVLLVVAAFVLPHLSMGLVTPLIHATPQRIRDYAQTAPIFGWWNAHVGWGTVPAIVIAVAAVLWGDTVARRLPWRALPWVTWVTACAWAFALAMIDGWQRGFAGRLTSTNEYLRQVPGVSDIPTALHTFSRRILDFQRDSWITHVSGHPPGALLTFVWLDRIGLGGGAWAGLLCLLVGSSAAAAVVVAVRALTDESTARLAAPFVVVTPTAIWVAVSADGYFTGVAAWGLALLALAVRGTARLPVLAGAGAGLLLGWGIFLNYGLGLIALPAVAVLIAAKDVRSALRAAVPAVLVVLAVVGVFALVGFWWFDGYTLVQQRYWQGIAKDRPFQYWSWANVASVVCAIGLGSVAGVARVFDVAAIKRRSGLHLVVLAALLAILCADVSMLSKAETERIWLPFTTWLVAAAALLPAPSRRWWLALNVIGALLLNHFILTNW
jgi:methylthioxylose transferase